jgi:hypothetical protein
VGVVDSVAVEHRELFVVVCSSGIGVSRSVWSILTPGVLLDFFKPLFSFNRLCAIRQFSIVVLFVYVYRIREQQA